MNGCRVIFDLDDTLYPERSFAVSAFASAGEWARVALGADGLAADMVRLLDDGHLGALFTLVLEQRGIDPAHASGLIEAYRRHEPAQLDLFDDALPVLEQLGEYAPLGLITDGTVGVQQSKVRALGLQKRFGEIIYTHGLGGRDFAKPHPAAYEAMMDALGPTQDRFVYVGDNPAKDFVSPNRMGWTTVQIIRPQRIHASAVAADGGAPHHIIETLRELPALLAR
jgi:putative hydrolase of the HAD superfamily